MVEQMRGKDFSFLPDKYRSALGRAEKTECVWEIRMRMGFPPIVRTLTGDYPLREGTDGENLSVTKEDLEFILLAVSGQAMYRISEAIANGAVFTPSGVRIGVAGRGISAAGEIRSITEISSLCIRFPYFKQGNAQKLLPYLSEGGTLLSVLICSPPAVGKTTLLRDFAHLLSQNKHLTVIDERMELACENGNNYDVLREVNKQQGILMALRSLSPEIIFCDELMGEGEIDSVFRAVKGGVTVFCSLHAKTYMDAFNLYPRLKSAFSRFIIIRKESDLRIAGVYDQNGKMIKELAL